MAIGPPANIGYEPLVLNQSPTSVGQPLSTPPHGSYRIVHTGDSKSLFGIISPFTGTFSIFQIGTQAHATDTDAAAAILAPLQKLPLAVLSTFTKSVDMVVNVVVDALKSVAQFLGWHFN